MQELLISGNLPEGAMTAEEIKERLMKTEKGAVKNNRQNCMLVLENDPLLKDAFRYNILTGRVDIVRKMWWPRVGQIAPKCGTGTGYCSAVLTLSPSPSAMVPSPLQGEFGRLRALSAALRAANLRPTLQKDSHRTCRTLLKFRQGAP